MRRWARRLDGKGREHASLLEFYFRLKKDSCAKSVQSVDLDPELNAFEGTLRKQFLSHRSREARLRNAKVAEVLKEKNGILECEVPGCRFDFSKKYGRIGKQYAIVHHLNPLAWAPAKGMQNSTKDLAIVCANCHVMIHRGGECRPLDSLVAR